MGTAAVVKAAQAQALLDGVAGLLAKQAKRKKTPLTRQEKARFAKKSVVLKLAAASITKRAVVGTIGAHMLRYGGKGLAGLSQILNKLGLGGAGKMVGTAGRKVVGTGRKALTADKALRQRAGTVGPITRKAEKQLAKVVDPRRKSLDIAELVGAGGVGAGTLGLGSALMSESE